MGLKKIPVTLDEDVGSIDFRMNPRKDRPPFRIISADRVTLFIARQTLTNSADFINFMTVEASRLGSLEARELCWLTVVGTFCLHPNFN